VARRAFRYGQARLAGHTTAAIALVQGAVAASTGRPIQNGICTAPTAPPPRRHPSMSLDSQLGTLWSGGGSGDR
jgi:hypothetical protein